MVDNVTGRLRCAREHHDTTSAHNRKGINLPVQNFRKSLRTKCPRSAHKYSREPSSSEPCVTSGMTMSYRCWSNLRTSWTPLMLFDLQKSIASVEFMKSIASSVSSVHELMSL